MGPRVGIGDGLAGSGPHGECVDGASIVGVAVGSPASSRGAAAVAAAGRLVLGLSAGGAL